MDAHTADDRWPARRITPIHPPRTIEISEIELRERLNGAERDWLLACLTAKSGVTDALYDAADSHRLVVAHDARELPLAELLDFLFRCGFYAEPAVQRLA